MHYKTTNQIIENQPVTLEILDNNEDLNSDEINSTQFIRNDYFIFNALK